MAQYRLDIVSNFTLFAVDSDNGDQVTQKDRRTFVGGKVSYRIVHDLGSPLRSDTSVGASTRSDDVRSALLRSRERQVLASVRDNQVNETSIGAYAKEELTLTKWLRVVGGGRADFFSFSVDDRQEQLGPAGATSGVKGATQLSPKASVVLTPLQQKNIPLDLYLSLIHISEPTRPY